MIKIPSRKTCTKGHRLQYYHNIGIQWCLWCPKCKKTGYFKKNFYRWYSLSKLDDFLEDLLIQKKHRFLIFIGVIKLEPLDVKGYYRWHYFWKK